MEDCDIMGASVFVLGFVAMTELSSSSLITDSCFLPLSEISEEDVVKNSTNGGHDYKNKILLKASILKILWGLNQKNLQSNCCIQSFHITLHTWRRLQIPKQIWFSHILCECVSFCACVVWTCGCVYVIFIPALMRADRMHCHRGRAFVGYFVYRAAFRKLTGMRESNERREITCVPCVCMCVWFSF